MAVTVLIIGTMDTKARELNFLRERIESEGVQSVLMDVSCKSKTAKHPFHISCEEVALEALEVILVRWPGLTKTQRFF